MPDRKLGHRALARLGVRPPRAAEGRDVGSAPDEPLQGEERLQRLEARLRHLEATLEGLQDSVYRETTRIDAQLAELREKTEPHAISQALSADARRRGI